MSRSNNKLMKVLFPLIAAVMAAFMAVSCGGGGGAATPNPNPNPGGFLGTITPIPGSQVQSASIDWQKVVAAISGGSGPMIAGQPGAAIAGAEVRAIDQNGLTAYTTANADGSFSFGNLPTGYWFVSGAPITLNQTGNGLSPSLDVTINII